VRTLEIHHLPTFILASVGLMLIPGVDMALVTRQVLMHGRRAAFATLGGLLVGGLAHAAFATIGLSAILLTSAAAYTAVKLVGAAYLITIGLQTIWASLHRHPSEETPLTDRSRQGGTRPMALRRAFLLGFISDITNPKVAVFFLSFLPQFVTPGAYATIEMATLGLLFNAIATSWWIGYVLFVERLSGWFRRPRVRTGLEGATGALLVALGIRLAVERR
jgi:threonine/homoserine/homoserine lactone efflux protein